ncbi:MAG: trypsin-like peptidase domain-containing protein [Nitrososphaerales archaeon]|nr:trypsin-like peptidase domain-containing protein [Nitrososphaerales archaeon]
METTQPRRTSRVVAVIVVLALLVGVTVFYYYASPNQTNASSAATMSSLQSEIASLQASIASLQAQLAGQPSSSSGLPSNTSAQAIFSEASRSVVTIQGDAASTVLTFFGQRTSYTPVLGSGFVTTYQGSTYVLTNFHVVDGMVNMTVTFPNGDAFVGKTVGTDAYSDLAVVTVQAPSSEFAPITVVDSTRLLVGQPVFAIGSPFGLSGSFTSGVISQLGRTIQEPSSGNYSISGVIQFSAPINPGNSGGPLLDANGNVVGITTATVSGSQGLGFAIPSHTILKELPSLIANGSYKLHSYLGIAGADMNYQLAQASQTTVTYGVILETVTPGSPASTAGLKAGTRTVVVDGQQYLVGGDIIVSVNGTRIVNEDALSSYLALNTVAGQTAMLGVIRNGNLTTIKVTLGARP